MLKVQQVAGKESPIENWQGKSNKSVDSCKNQANKIQQLAGQTRWLC